MFQQQSTTVRGLGQDQLEEHLETYKYHQLSQGAGEKQTFSSKVGQRFSSLR